MEGLRYREVLAIICFCLVCFGGGYMLGTYITITSVADVASRFITIDYETIQEALTSYKYYIKECYPIK